MEGKWERAANTVDYLRRQKDIYYYRGFLKVYIYERNLNESSNYKRGNAPTRQLNLQRKE